ncbi:hypothetical protein [Marinibacterium profundimaris]|uniref:Uncharacterized protein n=1 Tax=Marinibacterium profundimaris TaxID=1679460 RepID=A0A225NIJ4_9RHOB|nr:hypothetical protein [Marinibacterium profundimaris]OWU72893.1 hypothetical protein ATO3_14475 [Marinibacterium profundimaris]
MFSLRRIIFGLAARLMPPLTTGVLSPEATPAPSGQGLPTVSGDIHAATHGDAARFDREQLRALSQADFRKRTICPDGEKSFLGVPLSTLIQKPGGAAMKVRAYAARLSVIDLTDNLRNSFRPMDGDSLSRRTKRPGWIVHPHDVHLHDTGADCRTELICPPPGRQLDRIIVAT